MGEFLVLRQENGTLKMIPYLCYEGPIFTNIDSDHNYGIKSSSYNNVKQMTPETRALSLGPNGVWSIGATQ